MDNTSLISLYFSRHLQALMLSLGQLYRRPMSTSLTLLVIAIALALPAGLYIFVQNLQSVSAGWDNGTQISLYLKSTAKEQQVEQLLNELMARQDIAQVNYISPEQGLKEFSKQSNFGNVLSALADNPLPGVIMIEPSLQAKSPAQIEALRNDLDRYDSTDMVQLDMDWVQRLYSLLALGERATYALFILFSLGVLLIIGNTIHLATQNQQREIQIYQLAGASDAFIRRPFLYLGILYGLIGGMLSQLMISSILWGLSGPVGELAQLYNSNFQLQNLTAGESFNLLLISCTLGLTASWFVVTRHLNHEMVKLSPPKLKRQAVIN